jgi:hypothetical protein
MAEVIRSAKSGSDWTRNELFAYNIKIVPQTPEQFFGVAAAVSLAGLDPLIITGSTDTANLSDTSLRYLTYLDLAAHASQETLIDTFSLQTLDLLGYSERGLALFTRYNIPLTICGDEKNAQTDVCLLDGRSMILLILQEDKMVFNSSNPEYQVVAEAIAAYQYNNEKRERRGMATLDKMIFPCITMVGTRPTFYLVPVNRALSDAVATGQYPPEPTEVRKCVTIAGHNRSSSEGMEKPEYRRVALERFMAFRTLAKNHWEKFLV